MLRILLSTALFLSFATLHPVSATSIKLKSTKVEYPTSDAQFPGEGADAINNNCLACHSADHVLYQPLLSKEAWEEVVHKMVTAYKAPISPDDQKQIVEYLARTKSGP
jgi:mono/diheme cytochrome c family protein